MNKWEYDIEYVAFVRNETATDKEKYINERLMEQGNNGWELVAMDIGLLGDTRADGYLVFKRVK